MNSRPILSWAAHLLLVLLPIILALEALLRFAPPWMVTTAFAALFLASLTGLIYSLLRRG